MGTDRELLIEDRKRELEMLVHKWEVQEALDDLAFIFMQTIGVIWLAKRIGLPLKPWIKHRADGTIPLLTTLHSLRRKR